MKPSRDIKLVAIYDLYVKNLELMLQGGPDKDTLEAVRKFLKDEGINAESADRKAHVEKIVALTQDLPVFDPETGL